MVINNVNKLISNIIDNYNENIENIELYFELQEFSHYERFMTKIMDYNSFNTDINDIIYNIECNIEDLKEKEYPNLNYIYCSYERAYEFKELKENRAILLDFFINYYDNINVKESIIKNLKEYKEISNNDLEFFKEMY